MPRLHSLTKLHCLADFWTYSSAEKPWKIRWDFVSADNIRSSMPFEFDLIPNDKSQVLLEHLCPAVCNFPCEFVGDRD